MNVIVKIMLIMVVGVHSTFYPVVYGALQMESEEKKRSIFILPDAIIQVARNEAPKFPIPKYLNQNDQQQKDVMELAKANGSHLIINDFVASEKRLPPLQSYIVTRSHIYISASYGLKQRCVNASMSAENIEFRDESERDSYTKIQQLAYNAHVGIIDSLCRFYKGMDKENPTEPFVALNCLSIIENHSDKSWTVVAQNIHAIAVARTLYHKLGYRKVKVHMSDTLCTQLKDQLMEFDKQGPLQPISDIPIPDPFDIKQLYQ
jgi:hypothetical protein